MQEKKATGFFLEIFLVMSILGSLLAVAVPSVSRMIDKAGVASQDSELHNIQTAVIEMLCDSTTGTLEPVGPTDDMSEVRTSDTSPLVLADYLLGLDGGSLNTGCNYTFAADGTATQVLP